jgi:hypothetical protein
MRDESVKFCLMIVTADGWYPALNATPPTTLSRVVNDLENIIHNLRPGYGKYYLTHITKCDDKSQPSEYDLNVLERYRDNLLRRSVKLEE